MVIIGQKKTSLITHYGLYMATMVSMVAIRRPVRRPSISVSKIAMGKRYSFAGQFAIRNAKTPTMGWTRLFAGSLTYACAKRITVNVRSFRPAYSIFFLEVPGEEYAYFHANLLGRRQGIFLGAGDYHGGAFQGHY